MNIIETDFQFAVQETANEVKQTNPSKLCLTGGKFGSFLLNELIKINYAPHKENIYISVEENIFMIKLCNFIYKNSY